MKKLIILMPLYNDWKSVSKLLREIDSQIKELKYEVSVIIVNDASSEKMSELDLTYSKIKTVKIINMKKNRVTQRSIAAGLKYICKNEDFDRVIIMDSDGEDRPEEINDFLKKAEDNPEKTITGNRYKRSEGLVFKVLYEIHKVLTLIFTGKLIKFGNFSCLPKEHVQILIQKPYLWNSYSSSVVKAIHDRTSILSIRGYRYVLPAKMSFIGLIFHSLTIISVFRNEVMIRSILFLAIYLFLIFNNISVFTLFPILLLSIFTFTILKISSRTNIEGLDKSLDNIENVNILGSPDSR